jgi:ABC-type enterochelin transport system permease subunit
VGMNQNRIAKILLSVAALVHFLNFLFAGQMSIWGYVIPPILSLFVGIFLGYLAYKLKL